MAQWAAAGVKCVCVYAGPGKNRKEGRGRMDAAQHLVKGQIYTIQSVETDQHTQNVDVQLVGLPGAWNVIRFKPLQKSKRKTSIAVFQQILQKPSVPVAPTPEKVKAPSKAPV